jgi:hypothetical protein
MPAQAALPSQHCNVAAVKEVPVRECTLYHHKKSNHWNFYRKPSPDKPMFR